MSSHTKIFPKYNTMFESSPRHVRIDVRESQPKLPSQREAKPIASAKNARRRLEAGTQYAGDSTSRHPKSARACPENPDDNYYLPACPSVNIIDLKLSKSKLMPFWDRHTECHYDPPTPKTRFKECGVQTLYRESSAQTLPYLPEPKNPPAQLKKLEIFRLPEILPGNGPPGINEVEVLERARKRWVFADTLRKRFRDQIEVDSDFFNRSKHKAILEAFEWEHWLERETYIQECQMMRLELLIRMFNKREKEMHESSSIRIEMSCKLIEEKRDAKLRKNEENYYRKLRMLEIKRQDKPRNWRKENITRALGVADSDFYAPKARYGVNPQRFHFKGQQVDYANRMHELEERSIKMRRLECQFAKVNEWAKPKERFKEVEQNFCTDKNLKNLYETLKSLRTESYRTKTQPKCLIEKERKPKIASPRTPRPLKSREPTADLSESQLNSEVQRVAETKKRVADMHFRKARRNLMAYLIEERQTEELEALMADYEGHTIGWLMTFLSDELQRLEELRKLHLISILAQKERWRREAAEAGLRQKENLLRPIYEKLYNEADTANTDVADQYLEDILQFDIRDHANKSAAEETVRLARLIDDDLKVWLSTFHDIQNPKNYHVLRKILDDLVFPNAEYLVHQYETKQIVEWVIDDVLFPTIMTQLEPYDIATKISNNMIDRLIDNDLYLFSTDDNDSSGCSCCQECECNVAKREAKSILRKVIRHAVPGRRWRTPSEIVADENAKQILDDIFEQKEKEEKMSDKSPRPSDVCGKLMTQVSYTNLLQPARCVGEYLRDKSQSDEAEQEQKVQRLAVTRVPSESSRELITRKLERTEFYKEDSDELPDTSVQLLIQYDFDKTEMNAMLQQPQPIVTPIESELDILSHKGDLHSPYILTPAPSSELDNIPGLILPSGRQSPVTKEYAANLINDIICDFIPPEEKESDEEFSDTYAAEEMLNSVLNNVLKNIISSDSEEIESHDTPIPQEVGEEEEIPIREYELTITQSEFDDVMSDRCKCSPEIKRHEYIKQLLAEDKVEIRERRSVEASAISTFIYESSIFGGEEEGEYEGEFSVMDSDDSNQRSSIDTRASDTTTVSDAVMPKFAYTDDTASFGFDRESSEESSDQIEPEEQ